MTLPYPFGVPANVRYCAIPDTGAETTDAPRAYWWVASRATHGLVSHDVATHQ